MAILSKGHKSENFKQHKSLKLSFTNIRGLCSIFIGCVFFLELNSPDILGSYKTNLEDSTESSNSSVTGYLALIRKDSVTCMHGLAV